MYFKVFLMSVFVVVSEAAYEGERCFQDGEAGICRNLKSCPSAQEDLKLRKSPQICSYERRDAIVCCLDRRPTSYSATDDDDDEEEGSCAALPADIAPAKTGQKAFDKCIEYQEKFVYPCERGASILGDYSRGSHCHHETDDLILGGEDAAQYEFPHMVIVGYGRELKEVQWHCGGAIISERFILTAGHCIANHIGPASYVLIGALKRSDAADTSKIYKVKNITKHPQYYPPSKYNDIALIETEREMQLDQFTVPACLHVGDTDKDDDVLAAGWGFTHDKGSVSETLKKVILNKYSTGECTEKYKNIRLMRRGFDAQTQTCYGDKGQPRSVFGKLEAKDTCGGDSGGPIMIKSKKINCMYTIVGVTSIGIACGVPDQPGIYTKVDSYVPWIESIVWPK